MYPQQEAIDRLRDEIVRLQKAVHVGRQKRLDVSLQSATLANHNMILAELLAYRA